MDAITLYALKRSIEKWRVRAYAYAEHSNEDGVDCPLCVLFNHHVNTNAPPRCVGCPVAEKAGQPYCHGTPYYNWVDFEAADDETSESTYERLCELAKVELDFLISLLPTS
jgi:hypothetical protein